MIHENIKKRIVAITIFINDANNAKSTVAKSAYYRSAIMLTCTVIESLVYLLVEKDTANKGHVFFRRIRYKERHTLPANVTGGDNLVIAEKIKQDLRISDNDVTFDKLNRYLVKNGIVSGDQFKKLDYTRKERNKLHLQGLSIPDTGYTKSKFIKVSEPLAFIVKKL